MKKNTGYQLPFLLPLALIIGLATGCSPTPEATFRLQSDRMLPAGTPISLELPEGVVCCEGLTLKAEGAESAIPLQAGDDGKAVFLLNNRLPAESDRQYAIIRTGGPVAGPSIQETDTGLDISADGRPLLTYNTATLSPPEGLPDYYRRSGFIHPFYSPAGKVLTDGFPTGHTHQHGIFFAWVNTTYRGDFTDFWNQQKETGTVAFRALEAAEEGPVFAGFRSRHEHLSLKHGPVLEEHWRVRTYRLPGYNIIDLTSRQRILGSDTLFINKYHYGGMGVRLAAEWNEVDSLRYTGPMQVITSEGVSDRDSANHTRPHWTAVYGTIDGATAGLALFDHPSNFRFPQPVRVHPSMPYFVLTPMVEDAFELVPEEEYVFTCRIVSFDGKPDTEALEQMWRAYTEQPRVAWQE